MPDAPNFLDLPPELSDPERARAAVLCLPYEATTSYGKGTRRGPESIVRASTQVELYDEELEVEPCEVGIATVRPFEAGFPETGEPAVRRIAEACHSLLQAGKFVAALGGEHTVSVGLVEAHRAAFADLWVLQLDAHSDLRQEYQGTRWSHACTMARIGELCPFVGIGLRSGIRGERSDLAPPSRIFYAHEMRRDPDWPERVLDALGEHVYLTLDLDFFDPAIMPAVGTPEPGGFWWNETLTFLRTLCTRKTVVGFDVVELAPISGLAAPDFLAARLVYKLLGYRFWG